MTKQKPVKKLWDLDRFMTPAAFKRTLFELDLSKAACARLLGCSQRSVSRYYNGLSEIPPAYSMLLRAFADSGMFPIVPKWSKND